MKRFLDIIYWILWIIVIGFIVLIVTQNPEVKYEESINSIVNTFVYSV